MLWDNPPHRTSISSSEASRDTGGGNALAFTTVMTSVPCLINTASGAEQELFAQEGLTVSHIVAYKSSALSTPLVRGMKITDESGNSYHVEGIRSGRAFMNIPAFTFAQVRQII
jgi:hypothetical protein